MLALVWATATSLIAAPLRIVTLQPVLAEFAATIGGAEVAVTSLLRPGADPHAFDPTPADLRQMIDADLVIASGLGIEGFLGQLAQRTNLRGTLLVVGDRLPVDRLLRPDADAHDHDDHDHAHEHHGVDPHWWHSVALARVTNHLIRDALAALRPEQASAFAERAERQDRALAELGQWIASRAALVPPARRRLVTAHDAFGYLARDLGLKVVPLAGLSTAEEPDARRLATVIRQIRREHIPAVFVDAGASPALLNAIEHDTDARLGGELYADGLGPADSPAATYDGMMRHNVNTIVDALAPSGSN